MKVKVNGKEYCPAIVELGTDFEFIIEGRYDELADLLGLAMTEIHVELDDKFKKTYFVYTVRVRVLFEDYIKVRLYGTAM